MDVPYLHHERLQQAVLYPGGAAVLVGFLPRTQSSVHLPLTAQVRRPQVTPLLGRAKHSFLRGGVWEPVEKSTHVHWACFLLLLWRWRPQG